MSRSTRGTPAWGYGAVAGLVAVSYAIAAGWEGPVGLAAVVALAALVVVIGVVVGGVGIGRAGLDEVLPGALSGLLAVLYALSPAVLTHDVLRRRAVDPQTVLGAISAYLLIGMAFAFTYVTVQACQGPPSFGEEGAATVASSLFFSFTTLTTTGYGNLVPAGNPGGRLPRTPTSPGGVRPRRSRADIDASPRGDDDSTQACGQSG